MRILIITGIFPPDIGGPATYVPQIAKGPVDAWSVPKRSSNSSKIRG